MIVAARQLVFYQNSVNRQHRRDRVHSPRFSLRWPQWGLFMSELGAQCHPCPASQSPRPGVEPLGRSPTGPAPSGSAPGSPLLFPHTPYLVYGLARPFTHSLTRSYGSFLEERSRAQSNAGAWLTAAAPTPGNRVPRPPVHRAHSGL